MAVKTPWQHEKSRRLARALLQLSVILGRSGRAHFNRVSRRGICKLSIGRAPHHFRIFRRFFLTALRCGMRRTSTPFSIQRRRKTQWRPGTARFDGEAKIPGLESRQRLELQSNYNSLARRCRAWKRMSKKASDYSLDPSQHSPERFFA